MGVGVRRMIGLDAYTVAQLQVCKSLLVALLGDGVDNIDTAIDLIEGDVASRVAEVEEIQPIQPSKISTSGAPCPSPGCRGVLEYWPMASRLSGGIVIGCKTCHYSRMV